MSIKSYLKNKKYNHFTFSGVEVIIKDPLPNIDINEVLENSFSKIPKKFKTGIKKIKIGQFEELENRKIQAMFKDGTIFLTNKQNGNSDMIDDIVHEIAHSVEEIYKEKIYSDGSIRNEFLQKRKNMWMLLRDKGIHIELEKFLNLEYDEKFDEFLYKQVGYDVLSILLSSIFYSPYAATSIREYFANGFEAFFMKEDIDRLMKLSPSIYHKLTSMMGEE